MTIEITGSMAGHADRHTESSLAESFENAYFTAILEPSYTTSN